MDKERPLIQNNSWTPLGKKESPVKVSVYTDKLIQVIKRVKKS